MYAGSPDQIEYIGVNELAAAADEALKALPPEVVGDAPDNLTVRTIRWYLANDLLPPVKRKRRPALSFGREHVLTLLLIKKLQSMKLPISVIKTLVAGKTAEELEKLLHEEIRIFTDPGELNEYVKATGTKEEFLVVGDAQAHQEYIEAVSSGSGETRSEGTKSDAPPVRIRPRKINDWRRFEIAPGFEIHVSKGFEVPEDEESRAILLDVVRRVLENPDVF